MKRGHSEESTQCDPGKIIPGGYSGEMSVCLLHKNNTI